MSLEVPYLFKPQLRAILRAAAHGNLKVMFPMFGDVEELRKAKEILAECHQELEREGTEVGPVEDGVMIEQPRRRPSAPPIWQGGGLLLRRHERVSPIRLGRRPGQRALASSRKGRPSCGTEAHRGYFRAAEEAGVWVGVCGEAAGEPKLVPVLVKLGVTELSMSAPSIPRAKRLLSEL